MRCAFVSHSTVDDRYVAEMESFLRHAGYDDVFNDVSSIHPDERFWPAIEKGIAKADTLVVVITAASNASDWVKREVEYARSLSRKIIPVWIEDCPVPSMFEGRDVIDFRPRVRAERRIDISRIVKYAPADLIGRESETHLLNDSWQKVLRLERSRPHILTFVALGGEGKTSLVAKWAADLAAQDWPGCDAVFAWSFYSQGTREQTAVSSDLFLAEALTFFGDAAMAGSAQGAFEKGRRLAQLVGERRALLILDGLEPLQYAPTSPTPGELKDQGLSALLKGLAATSHGLCVVTTRIEMPDLQVFKGGTVKEVPLLRLSREAGVHLLKKHGVNGSDRRNLPLHDGDAKSELVSEFEKLVEDVDGHALTLHIMGSLLKKAFGGDIRKRDRVTFTKASQKTDNGHAFRAMAAYARWMEDGSDEARRELAILRLMGLFDRPATAGCLAALIAAPAIPGLTEPLTGLPEEDWNCSLESLVAAKLLTVSPETVSVPASAFSLPASLDAHPLLREYFAQELRAPAGRDKTVAPMGRNVKAQGNALGSGVQNSGSPEGATHGANVPPLQGSGDSGAAVPGALPQAVTSRPNGAQTSEAWRAAHRRLYEHLCASTQEGDQPTLEALQPLYQAVAHGCQAGMQQEACAKVYRDRILRGGEHYSWRKLGAFGSDLGAVASFYEQPWSRVSVSVDEAYQGLVSNQAALYLCALGRLREALYPMQAGVETAVKQGDWANAARGASSLSELELTLGEVAGAVGDAEQSVTYADRSGDAFLREMTRTTHADALHQAGRRAEAEARFREAEQRQAERQPAYPLLYGLAGFQYCDLLLAEAERAAWRSVVAQVSDLGGAGPHPGSSVPSKTGPTPPSGAGPASPSEETERLRSQVTDLGYNEALPAVSERATQALKWAEQARGASLLTIILDHLTLGRAALYSAILTRSDGILPSDRGQRRQDAVAPWETACRELDSAVSGLRRAGQSDELPKALLTRAWQRSLTGALTSAQAGPDSAQSDLDEAWEIAERGPMPLFLADIHLHRARLFFREAQYPWNQHPDGSPRGPADDLEAARAIITKVTTFTKPDGTTIQASYSRRLPELEDAERAILGAVQG